MAGETLAHLAALEPARAVAGPFAMKLPPVVEIGAGVTNRLADHARRLALRRLLIVTDAWLHANGPVEAIVRSLEASGVAAVVYDGVDPIPRPSRSRPAWAPCASTRPRAWWPSAAAVRSTRPRRSR